MKLGIIGGGRAGWFFGHRWKESGRQLAGIVVRDGSTSQLPQQLEVSRTDVATLATRSELILIAVRDAAIAEVVRSIAAVPAISNRVVFHCSGALPADILSPVPRRFSLHPLRALPAVGIEAQGPTVFAYEGPDDFKSIGADVVEAIGGTMFRVPSESKTLYHAAAAMAANYVALLADESTKMFETVGIGGREAREAVAMVAASALETWKNGTGAAAFSGPIARGEVDLVRRHLEALRGSDVFELYAGLARALSATMLELQPENPDYKEIASLLDPAPRG